MTTASTGADAVALSSEVDASTDVKTAPEKSNPPATEAPAAGASTSTALADGGDVCPHAAISKEVTALRISNGTTPSEGSGSDHVHVEFNAADPVDDSLEARSIEGKVDNIEKVLAYELDSWSSLDVYSLSNYSFGKNETESNGQESRGKPVAEIFKHRRERFTERGMRRTVAAVVLVHAHNFPHILLLQRSSGQGAYMLPGGRLRPGESEVIGLRRKLTSKLSPSASTDSEISASEIEIGEERT
jgi:Nucleotide hydrolase